VCFLPLFLLLSTPQSVESCCTVEVTVKTSTGTAVATADVRLESGAIKYSARTGADGIARSSLRAPGSYTVTVSAENFHPVSQKFDIARDATLQMLIVLPERTSRRDTVTVEGRVSDLSPDSPAASATGTQLESLPERVADVRNALPLLPGVVRTPEGRLNISGSPEYRSTLLVNSIDVTEPATGSFGPTVPIDIVEQLRIYKSPFLAEYGRFSAGVVAVTTRRGGEKWHYELNDPTPEFRIRSAHIVGIRGFTPRFAATGPVVRNRLFFSGATSFELRKRPVYPLPFPFNEEKQQLFNNYAQFDYVRRPTHLISFSAHGVPQRSNFVGLDFYTPQPAAPSWRAHDYRASLSDNIELHRGWLLESTLSVSENRGRTAGQGSELMNLTPVTTLGNYPFRADRHVRRVQWGEVASLPARHAAGRHHLKFGGTVGHTRMNGFVAGEHDIQISDRFGVAINRIGFLNRGGFRLNDTDVGLFAQDGWEPIRSVRLDLGIRSDWQNITGRNRIAPRAGLAWMPFEQTRTVIRSGLGWFYDRVPLVAYAWPLYPERNGTANVLAGRGLAPRSRTWSTGIDQPLGPAVLLHASYHESRSRGLLILEPRLDSIALANKGTALTRSAELIAKFAWYPEQQWVVSYVHTDASGDLNTYLDLAGNLPEAVIRPNLDAPLPDIVPHRFLSWGVFPLPHGLRFAPMFEWRSGFPYSALDQSQMYAETPNSRRLPSFLSLDLRVSKDIPVRGGHKVRLSFSMFNTTDHGNFDAVRLNTADPQFGEHLGRRPRRFRLDFDWLF
jgi:hypothetical protein